MVWTIIVSLLCGILGGACASAVSTFVLHVNQRRLALRLSDVEERQLREAKRYANLVGLNKQERDRAVVEQAVETLRSGKKSGPDFTGDPFLEKVWK